MQTKITSRATRIMAWLRETWAETGYANRRMIELRTASVMTPPMARQIDELEALYALPSREPDRDSD